VIFTIATLGLSGFFLKALGIGRTPDVISLITAYNEGVFPSAIFAFCHDGRHFYSGVNVLRKTMTN